MTSQEPGAKPETRARRGAGAVKIIIVIVLVAALALFARQYLGGKSGAEQPAAQAPPAPPVVLQTVTEADLAVGREYIGKVVPMQNVSVKPQVAGEIARVHFKEGSMVRAGQLLFTIDPRQFQATVELRKADLAKAEANFDRASKYIQRLRSADSRSVSASDLDIAENDVLQGRAAIEQAKAALRLAQIDLGYTRITAPISGQIGRAFFTKGNYVSPSSGPLADIVQTDPIRVEFSLPDRDYLDQLADFRASGSSVFNTTIRLSNGESYPASGERDFEDNAIDGTTGTMRMYVRFENEGGLLVPGSMVRVSTKPVKSHVSPIAPQEGVLADAEGDYVYVVGKDNIARARRVKLGAEVGPSREVISGLAAGENVIIRGLQSVRPDAPVKPSFMKANGESKTPAELAMESGHDPLTVSADAASADATSGDGAAAGPGEDN